jgi:hypothetical protein
MRFEGEERREEQTESFVVVEIEQRRHKSLVVSSKSGTGRKGAKNGGSDSNERGKKQPFVMPRNLSLQWRQYGVGGTKKGGGGGGGGRVSPE